MTLAVMAKVTVFNEVLIDELSECFESEDERQKHGGRIGGVDTPAFEDFHPGFANRVKTAPGADYQVESRQTDAFEVDLVVRDRDGDAVGAGSMKGVHPVPKPEMITVAAQATLFDEVIFQEEKEYPLDGEYAFDDIRAGIVERIEEELEWEYEVKDCLVDGCEVKISIYDYNDPGDPVGDGYIKA